MWVIYIIHDNHRTISVHINKVNTDFLNLENLSQQATRKSMIVAKKIEINKFVCLFVFSTHFILFALFRILN